VAGAATAQASGTPSVEASSALRGAAQQAVARGAVGFLARVDDGNRVTDVEVGLADRATGRRLAVGDQFEAGSNTKTFTAVLILQLVARGRLALDDTVEEQFPGLVPNGDEITIKMLLQHTSGLFDYLGVPGFLPGLPTDPNHRWTPRQLVEKAVANKPLFAPGASWSYSNTNYVLLGMIAEKTGGKPYADLLQERIARPLGLRHTYYPTDAPTNTGRGFAREYTVTFHGDGSTYTDTSTWSIGRYGSTAGAVISTSSDLARFYSALLGGELLPAAQLAEMKQTVPTSEEYQADGMLGYGLGLARISTPCGTAWGHGGDTVGTHSRTLVSEDGRTTAVTARTTQINQFDPPTTTADEQSAQRFAAAGATAENTAFCTMFGKPLPATTATAAAH
jgi:D-alanyl-D-alanine carboxypeptidase